MMKRTIAKILLFTLVLGIGVLPFVGAFAEGEILATVLFTSDTRGFTESLSYIERFKENTENSLLIGCGNFSKGSAEASFSNAKYSSLLMKEAEYDLISLGTDDFAYGYRATKRFADYTQCTLLSGNVRYSSAEIFEENTIKNVGSLKIGFFSLADSGCLDYLPSARKDGYRFDEEIQFAKEQVELLRQKCDKVICLASFMENNNNFTPESFLEEVIGIDVLICSGLETPLNKTISDTLVLNTRDKLQDLGVITFSSLGTTKAQILPEFIYNEKNEVLDTTEGTYRCYGQSLVYNTAREKILEDFEKNITDPIALNKTTIYGTLEQTDISLLEETPLGDLFADALTIAGDKIKSANNDFKNDYVVACVNGTAIKNNIPSGSITLRNVFDAAQIAEDVYFYQTDSSMLFELMERSVSEICYDAETDFVYSPSRLFLQISGFNVLVDPSKKAGERIQKMYLIIGDDEIQVTKNDEKSFLLAVNASLAKGAEGYDNLLNTKPVYVGDFLVNYLRTAIASAVNEDYYISPGTESRITFKRIEELQPNGDAWATLKETFEEHAACEVLVDGLENMDCSQVDENGEVRITLKTGAHGVTVNGYDCYVSTQSGIGIKEKTITPIVDYKLYYKTLDEAYKIDEDAFDKEAVKGYFEYLSRAYVQTKLTEEGEVVKATQDILNVFDDFQENPNAFIKTDAEEEEEELDESEPYPKLSDFAYRASFSSSVFENTPAVSTQSNKNISSRRVTNSSDTAHTNTGDAIIIVLWVVGISFFIIGCGILSYFLMRKKGEIEYDRN